MYPYQNLSLSDIHSEIWKDIKGFEGFYMVSNYGRVKSMERTIYSRWVRMKLPTKIRKQDIAKNHSLNLTLHISGIKHKLSVARLVYNAFVEPIPFSKMGNNLIIGHHNNDPKDNRVENLYLISQSDFSKKQMQLGISLTIENRKISAEGREKIRLSRCKKVSQYTGEGVFLQSYSSITEASQITGVRQTSIWASINGKCKSAGGFIWKEGSSSKPLSRKRVKLFQERRYHNRRPVEQYTLSGEYIKTFINISKAAYAAGYDRRKFSYNLYKGTFLCNGFMWQFTDTENKIYENPNFP